MPARAAASTQTRPPIASPITIADLERDILPFPIAKGLQTSSEGIGEWIWGRSAYQYADTWQLLRLLRAGLQPGPLGQNNADKNDELPPFHSLLR